MTSVALAITHLPTATDVVAAALAAERAGLDEVWIAEDLGQHGGIALASAILAATQRLRVGIGVLNPTTRHPYLLAMEYATLHQLSGGRCVLGLGTGNLGALERELGLTEPRPLTRLVEATGLVRAALAGEPYDGTTVRSGAPVARPPHGRLPVYWGVKGERALERSAEHADGLLLSMLTTAPYVRRVREVVGPRPHVAAYVMVVVDDDVARARDAVRAPVTALLALQGDNALVRAAGVDPAVAAGVAAAVRAGEPVAVDDDVVDALAVVGPPAACRARVAELAAAGLDTVVVRGSGAQPVEELVATAAALRTGPDA